MSLRHRLVANYGSQAIVAASNILVVPLFWGLIGAEGYGLVSFFGLMQSWFQLLDLGLGQTLAREATRYRGGALDSRSFSGLLRASEFLFWIVGLLASVSVIVLSKWLSQSWLRAPPGTGDTVVLSIRIMAAIAAARWVATLYRSVLQGLEEQFKLSGLASLVAILRTFGVLLILKTFGATIEIFFIIQLIIAAAELLVLIAWARRAAPPQVENAGPLTLKPLLGIAGFSASVAFSSAVWFFLSQADKLVLSRIMTLSEFGAFSLSVVVAGLVHLMAGPLGQVVLPRLTALYSAGNAPEFTVLYHRATRIVSIMVFPVSVAMAAAAEVVLYVWSGDQALSHSGAGVFRFYVLGNALLSLSSFQYYLQYAKGDLRLNLVANVAFLLVFFPILVLLVREFGVLGAGWGWFGQAAFYLLVWSLVVHARSGLILHWKWLGRDIGLPLLVSVIAALLLQRLGLVPSSEMLSQNRAYLAVRLIGFGLLVLLPVVALSGWGEVRALFSRFGHQRLGH